ncbi:protein klaA [Stenotrophomonas sp. 24(2023)]|uniref:protein klaA n=1 Tax=Stenotrophomonas sp. 24(2023) TaxID=3068324 RepID=UPI0027DFF55A|nr:protein klaA [Stenotrophomonas sp. 24(2023)]WMJ71075.1 protein klaA [Stenotrophomonas sp. 24(2023)]
MSTPLPPAIPLPATPQTTAAPDAAPATLAQLKHEVLPALFAGRIDIGRYGPPGLAQASVEPSWHDGSTTALAQALGELVARLPEHDPRALLQAGTWWQRFTGADIEARLRRRIAMGSNTVLMGDIEQQAVAVRANAELLQARLKHHDALAAQLQVYIDAGLQFLQELPADAADDSDPLRLDRPVERLQRRVANLTALQGSHAMSRMQLQLARRNAIELLDRYSETVEILLPIWRQTILALHNADDASAQMVASAAQAQDQLMQALQQLLQPTGAAA